MIQGAGGRPVRTRFAPSPTGYLHLGHVVNAIYVWGMAQALDGVVILRIEDHDRIRSRPDYETSILADLEWLELAGTCRAAGDAAVTRQRDRDAIYQEALHRLRQTHQVYACDCSRSDIGGERYPGRCRDRGLSEGPGRGVRVHIAPGIERFEDLRLGLLEQSPADQCGDLLIRDRDGHWTYQFAVTVDDRDQGITLVIRGEDLLSSTGRQLRLARMLAGAASRADPPSPLPRYLHHPLVLGADGAKLSKSTGAAGVRGLRAEGLTPADVLGTAAAAVGLLPRPRPLHARALGELFTGDPGMSAARGVSEP